MAIQRKRNRADEYPMPDIRNDQQEYREFLNQTGLDSFVKRLPASGKKGRSGGFSRDMAGRLAAGFWNGETGEWRKPPEEMVDAGSKLVDWMQDNGHYGDIDVSQVDGAPILVYKPHDSRASVTILATRWDRRQPCAQIGSTYKDGVRTKLASLENQGSGGPKHMRYTAEHSITCAAMAAYGSYRPPRFTPAREVNGGIQTVGATQAFVPRGLTNDISYPTYTPAKTEKGTEYVLSGKGDTDGSMVSISGKKHGGGTRTAASAINDSTQGKSTPKDSVRVIDAYVDVSDGRTLNQTLRSGSKARILSGIALVSYNETYDRDLTFDAEKHDDAMVHMQDMHLAARQRFESMFSKEALDHLIRERSGNPNWGDTDTTMNPDGEGFDPDFDGFTDKHGPLVAEVQEAYWKARFADGVPVSEEESESVPFDYDVFMQEQLDRVFGRGVYQDENDGSYHYEMNPETISAFAGGSGSQTNKKELQACVKAVARGVEAGYREDGLTFDYITTDETDPDRDFERSLFVDGTVHFNQRDLINQQSDDQSTVIKRDKDGNVTGMNLTPLQVDGRMETPAEYQTRMEGEGLSEFWIHKGRIISYTLANSHVTPTSVQVDSKGVVAYAGTVSTTGSKNGQTEISGEIGQIFEPDLEEMRDGKLNPLRGSVKLAYEGSDSKILFPGYAATITPLRSAEELRGLQQQYDTQAARAQAAGRPALSLPDDLQPVPLHPELSVDDPNQVMIPRGEGNYVQRTKCKDIVQLQDEAIQAELASAISSGETSFDGAGKLNAVYRRTAGSKYPEDIIERYRTRGMADEEIYANLQTESRMITYPSDITNNSKMSAGNVFERDAARDPDKQPTGFTVAKDLMGSYRPEVLLDEQGRYVSFMSSDRAPVYSQVETTNLANLDVRDCAGCLSATKTNMARSTGNQRALCIDAGIAPNGYITMGYNPDGTPQITCAAEETETTRFSRHNNPDRNQMANSNISTQQYTMRGNGTEQYMRLTGFDENGQPITALESLPDGRDKDSEIARRMQSIPDGESVKGFYQAQRDYYADVDRAVETMNYYFDSLENGGQAMIPDYSAEIQEGQSRPGIALQGNQAAIDEFNRCSELAAGNLHGEAIALQSYGGYTQDDAIVVFARSFAEQDKLREKAALEAAAQADAGSEKHENAYIQDMIHTMIDRDGYGRVQDDLKRIADAEAHPEWDGMSREDIARSQAADLNAFCNSYGYIQDRIPTTSTHDKHINNGEEYQRGMFMGDKLMTGDANKGVASVIVDPEMYFGDDYDSSAGALQNMAHSQYADVVTMIHNQGKLVGHPDSKKAREYQNAMMQYAEESQRLMAFADANPHVRFGMSSFSQSSRMNSSCAKEAIDTSRIAEACGIETSTTTTAKHTDVQTVDHGVMHANMIMTDMPVDVKSHDENMHTDGGRNVSAQVLQALSVKGTPGMIRELYEPNAKALADEREALIVLGMDINEEGTLRVGYQPHIIGVTIDENGVEQPVPEDRKVFRPLVPKDGQEVFSNYCVTSENDYLNAGAHKGKPDFNMDFCRDAGGSDLHFSAPTSGGLQGFEPRGKVYDLDEKGEILLITDSRGKARPSYRDNDHFQSAIPDEGGMMRLPFNIRMKTGEMLTAQQDENGGPDFYVLPVMSTQLRQGRETVSGEMEAHDYTKRYEHIWDLAVNYEATRLNRDFANTALQASQQAGAGSPEALQTLRAMEDNGFLVGEAAKKDRAAVPVFLDKERTQPNPTYFTRFETMRDRAESRMARYQEKAQQEYDSIASSVAERYIERKENNGKNLMKSKQEIASTKVITPDPNLDIDVVRISASTAKSLGIQLDSDGKWDAPDGTKQDHARILIGRDPLLSEGGLRYVRTEIVPDSDDPRIALKGCKVHPSLMESFEGDFDGDSIYMLNLRSKEAYVEAMSKFTLEAEMVNREVEPGKKGNKLNVNMGLDVATGCYADEQRRQREIEAGVENPAPTARELLDDAQRRANEQPSDFSVRNPDGSLGIDYDAYHKAQETTKQVSDALRQAYDAGFGHDAVSFGGIQEHVDSLFAQVRDNPDYCPKAKNFGKFAAYLNNLGYDITDIGPDGKPMQTDDGKPRYELVREGAQFEPAVDKKTGEPLLDGNGKPKMVLTANGPADAKPRYDDNLITQMDDRVASFQAINAKAELTGTAGRFLQHASMLAVSPDDKVFDRVESVVQNDTTGAFSHLTDADMQMYRDRGSFEKAATSLTHPVTQSVMQLKHDTSEEIKHKCDTIQNVLPQLWEGKQIDAVVMMGETPTTVPIDKIWLGDKGETPQGMHHFESIHDWQATENADYMPPDKFVKTMEAYYRSPAGLNVPSPPKKDMELMTALMTDAESGRVMGFSSYESKNYDARLQNESALQRMGFEANLQTIIDMAANNENIYGDGVTNNALSPAGVKHNKSEAERYRTEQAELTAGIRSLQDVHLPRYQTYDGTPHVISNDDVVQDTVDVVAARIEHERQDGVTHSFVTTHSAAEQARMMESMRQSAAGELDATQIAARAQYAERVENAEVDNRGKKILKSSAQFAIEQETKVVQQRREEKAAQAAMAPPPDFAAPPPEMYQQQMPVPPQAAYQPQDVPVPPVPQVQTVSKAEAAVPLQMGVMLKQSKTMIPAGRFEAAVDASCAIALNPEILAKGEDGKAKYNAAQRAAFVTDTVQEAFAGKRGVAKKAAAAGEFYSAAMQEFIEEQRAVRDGITQGELTSERLDGKFQNAALMVAANNAVRAKMKDGYTPQEAKTHLASEYKGVQTARKKSALQNGIEQTSDSPNPSTQAGLDTKKYDGFQ